MFDKAFYFIITEINMKIKFFGATEKVTGSKLYFEFNHKKILVDYGMEQEWKSKLEVYKNNFKLNFEPSEIDYIFLTHAHIDHSGLIPYLVKKGFEWKIITNIQNQELLHHLWEDSCYIIAKDYEYLTKKKNEKKLELLYWEKDYKRALNKIIPIGEKQPIYLTSKGDLVYKDNEVARLKEDEKGNYFVFYNNWHIVGSSSIVFNYKNKKWEKNNICFSGDIWRKDAPLLKPFEYMTDLKNLVLESTYWDRIHNDIWMEEKKFEKILLNWLKKWKVIIPSFSLDRTQTLIYFLKKIKEKGKLGDIPIYIDTPLGNKITKIYEKSLMFFKSSVVEEILWNSWKLFSFEWLREIETVEESKWIISSKKPCIVIAASWMAENWRVLFHIEEELKNENTTILFVWFTVPWSLWYQIKNSSSLNIKEVKINSKIERIKANIQSVSFSSHGDLKDLLHFIKINTKLKQIILNHWNLEAKENLKKEIEKINKNIEVKIAKNNFYYSI